MLFDLLLVRPSNITHHVARWENELPPPALEGWNLSSDPHSDLPDLMWFNLRFCHSPGSPPRRTQPTSGLQTAASGPRPAGGCLGCQSVSVFGAAHTLCTPAGFQYLCAALSCCAWVHHTIMSNNSNPQAHINAYRLSCVMEPLQ